MRLELSKRTDYALLVLVHLESDGVLNGKALAAAAHTTVGYLPQIVKPLTEQGWMNGTSGPGGGYRLTISLEEVSVLEVIEAMEGKTDETQCVLKGAPCPSPEPCVLHDSWVLARGALLSELGAMSVATTLAPAPMEGE